MASAKIPGQSIGFRLTDITVTQLRHYEHLEALVLSLLETSPLPDLVELYPPYELDRESPIDTSGLPRPWMSFKIRADDIWWPFTTEIDWTHRASYLVPREKVATDESVKQARRRLLTALADLDGENDCNEATIHAIARMLKAVASEGDIINLFYGRFDVRNDEVWVEVFHELDASS